MRHRVPFYETDAMGIVHHANYVKYLELARVVYLEEHDRSYRDYMAEGLHFGRAIAWRSRQEPSSTTAHRAQPESRT